MKKVLRYLVILLVAIAVCVAAVAVVARYSDGPIGPFPGGPIEGGTPGGDVSDWGFATDIRELEFQLLEPPRTRRVWLIVEDGALFIPCGAPNFTLWKQWPHEAEQDGRAVLRIDGKVYRGDLTRVHDPNLRATLLAKTGQKYDIAVPETPVAEDDVWFFRFQTQP